LFAIVDIALKKILVRLALEEFFGQFPDYPKSLVVLLIVLNLGF
jgi:hypothetical protein